MTTIAYRNGIMAADSGSRAGDAKQNWARKLAKGTDGTLYGACGNAAQCETFLGWVDDGCVGDPPAADKEPEGHSSFLILVAPIHGRLQLITAYGVEKYKAPYFALGYDSGVAYGAMFTGANAPDAIAAAIEHGVGSSGPLAMIRHSETF